MKRIMALTFITWALFTNCEEGNSEQKPPLTAEFCEAIRSEERCLMEGCTPLRPPITFVDTNGNCAKKTVGGFICLHTDINFHSLDNDDQIDEPYLRALSNGWIAGLMAKPGTIHGWTRMSQLAYAGQDHCCAVDSDSCAEPWEEFTGQWFPFEGLLD